MFDIRADRCRITAILLFDAFMNQDIPDRFVPHARTANSPRFLLFLICLFASAHQLAKAIITDSFSGQALIHAFTYGPARQRQAA